MKIKKAMIPSKKQKERMATVIKCMQLMYTCNQIDATIEFVYEEMNELMWDYTKYLNIH